MAWELSLYSPGTTRWLVYWCSLYIRFAVVSYYIIHDLFHLVLNYAFMSSCIAELWSREGYNWLLHPVFGDGDSLSFLLVRVFMCILHPFCSFSSYIINDLFHIGSYWFYSLLCSAWCWIIWTQKYFNRTNSRPNVFGQKNNHLLHNIKQNKQSAEHFHDAYLVVFGMKVPFLDCLGSQRKSFCIQQAP